MTPSTYSATPMLINERLFLFKGEMVCAILDDIKTHTRRICKDSNKPPCEVGEVILVKETHRFTRDISGVWRIIYKADGASKVIEDPYPGQWRPGQGAWKPSIFMRKIHSRIKLKVLSVHSERLQLISEEDAKAEGVRLNCKSDGTPLLLLTGSRPIKEWTYREHFAELWDRINKSRGYGWDSNPWVWVVKFKRLEG